MPRGRPMLPLILARQEPETLERWVRRPKTAQALAQRRGVHRNTRELEATIVDYIQVHNQRPKPFVWTKTADEILASLARFCQRISNSGHWQHVIPRRIGFIEWLIRIFCPLPKASPGSKPSR